MIIVVIVVLVVIGGVAVVNLGSKSTETIFSNTAQSSSSAPATDSHQLSINVTQTALDPPEASTGHVVYIYSIVIVDTDATNHHINPINFELLSSSKTIYQSSTVMAMRQALQSVTLSTNQRASGQIAFQIVNGDTPSQLEYNYSLESVNVIVTNLPVPSSQVSLINFGFATVVGNQCIQPNEPRCMSHVNAQIYVENSSSPASAGYFYTGDVIYLKLTVTNLNSAPINITSITDSDSGFQIVGITPRLPVTLDSSEFDITVYITAPSVSFSGTPHIVLNQSP